MSEEDEGIDVQAMYRSVAPLVRALVVRNISAPDEVIEEACQVAWSRLVTHRREVAREAAVGWLATTAMRETLRALRACAHQLSLDDAGPTAAVIELPERAPGPDRMLELREQLAEVRRLPVRQRQMLWLRGLGYDYNEIAARTGVTYRTVERQLHRARCRLRDASAEAGAEA
jgi:RNA polymerase sigma factor (sigma-70 family)